MTKEKEQFQTEFIISLIFLMNVRSNDANYFSLITAAIRSETQLLGYIQDRPGLKMSMVQQNYLLVRIT